MEGMSMPEAATLERPSTKSAATNWLDDYIERSQSGVVSEIVQITPAMAVDLLERNPDNRRLRPAKLAQMISDMREKRWSFNGEPIIVADTGELNDGQHRLEAVVQSGVTLTALMVFGIDRATRTTLDQGASRTAGDFLHMLDMPNAYSIAAIGRMVLAYERSDRKTLGRDRDITTAEVMERATTDLALATSATYSNRHQRRMAPFARATIIGFCHYVLMDKDAQDAMKFMDQLCTGENLQRGDPAYMARTRLQSTTDKKSRLARVEIIFRAWNAFREGRELAMIPVKGALPELV
jgi:hypothetical protein